MADPITDEAVAGPAAGPELSGTPHVDAPPVITIAKDDADLAGQQANNDAALALKDAEIATLKSQLALAEQRASLPPLAGNPGPQPPMMPRGEAAIRAAIEGK